MWNRRRASLAHFASLFVSQYKIPIMVLPSIFSISNAWGMLAEYSFSFTGPKFFPSFTDTLYFRPKLAVFYCSHFLYKIILLCAIMFFKKAKTESCPRRRQKKKESARYFVRVFEKTPSCGHQRKKWRNPLLYLVPSNYYDRIILIFFHFCSLIVFLFIS